MITRWRGEHRSKCAATCTQKKKEKNKNNGEPAPLVPIPSAMSEHRSVRLGEWDCTQMRMQRVHT